MKTLTIICMVLFVILSAGQTIALPGIYKAGSSTMNLFPDECNIRTISMDGTGWGTSPLVSGGFCMSISDPTKIDVTDIWCYQGVPPFWPMVEIIPDPGFTCVFTGSPDEGVPPSSNILICDVTFCGAAEGSSTITIDTIPELDTWVAQDFTVYDPTIDADVIEARVLGDPCECVIDGPISVRASGLRPSYAQYTASGDAQCVAPVYVYTSNCTLGTINATTGLLTVPPTLVGESCVITATDTANTDVNTGDPVECCLNIEIWSDW